MQKLVIVDDEDVQARQIRDEVLDWQANRKKIMDIHVFDSGEKLIDYCDLEDNIVDIAVLDMQMPGMDGIETGKKLREIYPDCVIIYVTNYIDPVCEAFKVGTFRYILKEKLHEAIREALDSAVKNINDSRQYFVFSSKKQQVRLLYKRIVNFESRKRVIRINLADGSVKEYYGKLSEVEKQINDRSFVRCHQSYIVNANYIEQVEGSWIYLNNNIQIPISNKYMEAVEKAIMWAER